MVNTKHINHLRNLQRKHPENENYRNALALAEGRDCGSGAKLPFKSLEIAGCAYEDLCREIAENFHKFHKSNLPSVEKALRNIKFTQDNPTEENNQALAWNNSINDIPNYSKKWFDYKNRGAK